MKIFLFTILVFLCFTTKAQPAISTDFELYSDGDSITTEIPFVVLSGATVLTAGVSLNEYDFPPRSGVNAVVDGVGGILFQFTADIDHFETYVTYVVPVVVTFFGEGSQVIGTRASRFTNNTVFSGVSGSSPNELLTFGGGARISSLKIEGSASGQSFVMDDLSFQVSQVPEVNVNLMLLVGLLALAAHRHHRSLTQLTNKKERSSNTWMRRLLLVGVLCIVNVPVNAQQNLPPAPVLTPDSIGVNQPIFVNVVADVGLDKNIIPESVSLIKYDAQNKLVAVIGRMYDDGLRGDKVAGDGIYSIQIYISEGSPLVQQYRVSVATRNSPIRSLSASTVFVVQGVMTAEETLADVANHLESGNIEAALRWAYPSSKKRGAINRMSSAKRAQLAASLRQARLIQDNGNVREYEVPFNDGGAIVYANVTLSKLSSGFWQIISW